MKRAAAAVLGALLSGCTTHYVPDTGWNVSGTGWRSEAERADFYEDWWGRQLAAMREPELATAEDLDGLTQRYRVTVVPSFTSAYAIRIDWRADGTASLHWVLLDGAGGYDPGRPDEKGSRHLSAEEAGRIAQALEAADLPAMPMDEPLPSGARVDHGDGTSSQQMFVCPDGTHYLFEVLTPQRRAFIERGFCGPNDDDDATLFALIEQTGALTPPAWIHEAESRRPSD